MRPDQVPQAAVDAAYDGERAAETLVMRHALAAAAPHLIDDAMIERAARSNWAQMSGDIAWADVSECVKDGYRARAEQDLYAALGEVDGDGR